MARPKNIDDSEKIDRQIVNLEVDIFYLKSSEFLVLPETPYIFLSQEKTKQFIKDLKDAIDYSKDGVIIRLQGEINPKEEKRDSDGSMFLSKEVKVEDILQNKEK
jgi:hypothetical protein